MADLHPEVLALIEAGPRRVMDLSLDSIDPSRLETPEEFARRIALREQELVAADLAMMIRRLAARLQLRTKGTKHEQADESLVASALDLLRRNGVDLSPLREHRLEQSDIRRRGKP